MKLLLDESCPRRLKGEFSSEHEVLTVQERGWSGAKNGALLLRAADSGFLAMITADKNLGYQQNVTVLPLAIVILESVPSRLSDLAPLIPKVESLLAAGVQPEVYRVVT